MSEANKRGTPRPTSPGAETKPGSRGESSRAQATASAGADPSRPADFEGEVATGGELPSPETLDRIKDYLVLDRDGRSHSFQSLHSGRNAARRVLVVFVRHFFYGNCQEYLRSLSASVTPEALLRLPVSTCVVGCGNPGLIDMYVKATGCPFPVYTDPTRFLFDQLGMVKTLVLGPRPAYMKKSMAAGFVESVGQALRSVPDGLALESGDHRQVGGEFLFEPVDVVTPVVTPVDEAPTPGAGAGPRYGGRGDDDGGPIEPKRVTWCHRMRTTRDHAEVPEVMDVLGLERRAPASSSTSDKDRRRWDKASQVRKGSGGSLAAQMKELSEGGGTRAS